MLDLGAYLERIGLAGTPTLAAVHRAHATTIPFENLDPQRGVPVSLAIEDVERKLVGERRGGYCFEQNLLLAAALRELGAEVELLLARVRVGAPPGTLRPRSHLVLQVRAEGAVWHADVGFGLGTLLDPLPFGPSGEHEQSGWLFRVLEDGPELVLQSRQDGEWVDQYGFVPEPAPMVDLETNNWFTATHPSSPFVSGLIVSRHHDDGTRTWVTDWAGSLTLNERGPQHSRSRELERAELPELLGSQFGLPGFAVGAGGRVVPAADAAETDPAAAADPAPDTRC